MRYDYSKLIGAIITKFGTMTEFANMMSMTPRTLYNKLYSVTDWSQDEMRLAMKLLEIPMDQIRDYFFIVDGYDIRISC